MPQLRGELAERIAALTADYLDESTDFELFEDDLARDIEKVLAEANVGLPLESPEEPQFVLLPVSDGTELASKWCLWAYNEIIRLRAWRDAVRRSHNGYDPEMRAALPALKEPLSPADAIRSLLQEENELGMTEERIWLMDSLRTAEVTTAVRRILETCQARLSHGLEYLCSQVDRDAVTLARLIERLLVTDNGSTERRRGKTSPDGESGDQAAEGAAEGRAG
jgi:hypothetical protein